jgi:hypothetical protein
MNDTCDIVWQISFSSSFMITKIILRRIGNADFSFTFYQNQDEEGFQQVYLLPEQYLKTPIFQIIDIEINGNK